MHLCPTTSLNHTTTIKAFSSIQLNSWECPPKTNPSFFIWLHSPHLFIIIFIEVGEGGRKRWLSPWLRLAERSIQEFLQIVCPVSAVDKSVGPPEGAADSVVLVNIFVSAAPELFLPQSCNSLDANNSQEWKDCSLPA